MKSNETPPGQDEEDMEYKGKFNIEQIGVNVWKKNKLTIIFGVLVVFIMAFKDIIVPDMLGKIVEKVEKKGKWYDINVGMIYVILVWLGLWLLSLVYDWICTILYPKTEDVARNFMLQKVMYYLQNSFQDFSHAELLTQIVQFPNMVSDWYYMIGSGWLPEVAFLIVVVIVSFYYHYYLGIIAIVTILCLIGLLLIFWKKTEYHAMVKERSKIDIQEYVLDIFINTLNVLTFGTKQNEIKEMQARENIHKKHYEIYYRLSILLKALMTMIAYIMAVAVVFVCFHLYKKGIFHISRIVSIIMILSFIISKIMGMAGMIPNLFFYLGIIRNVENIKILGEPDGFKQTGPVTAISSSTMSKEPLPVSFQHVYYKYPTGKTNVLENVSFEIPAGKIVLLKGRVGRGKSTIMHILMGFRIPDAGIIKIGNKILGQCSLEEWRQNVVYLSQHPTLFNRNLYENITYGNTTQSAEDIFQLMDKTGYDEWISKFPHGLRTMGGSGGSQLSGGQKQLISLFRCLLTPKPVILLDEPTASLDKNGKEMVYAVLNQLRGKSTIIIVTHDDHVTKIADMTIQL